MPHCPTPPAAAALLTGQLTRSQPPRSIPATQFPELHLHIEGVMRTQRAVETIGDSFPFLSRGFDRVVGFEVAPMTGDAGRLY